jgi:hypothetical protein
MSIQREQIHAGDQVTFTAKIVGPDQGTMDYRVCVELADQYIIWLPIDRIIAVKHEE